jgi:hypothetical protein
MHPKPLSQPHPTLLVGGGVETSAAAGGGSGLPMMPMNEDPRLSELVRRRMKPRRPDSTAGS